MNIHFDKFNSQSIFKTKIYAFDAYLMAANDQPRYRAVLVMWSVFST